MRQLIKRILNEEREKDLSSVIKKLLQPTINNYKEIICNIDVASPSERERRAGSLNFKYTSYMIIVTFVGGYGSENWPHTQEYSKKKENIINEIWKIVYNFLEIPCDMYSKIVKSCDEVMTEGLHDTSWQNDEGDKITLVDLLDATKDIPIKNISVEKLKPKLLSWNGNKKEIAKIERANLKYPILIFVDDKNKLVSIIDGHHRAQKAVKHKLKSIKAKLIPINSLPKNIRKVFSHLGKQEETEGVGAYAAPAFEMKPDHEHFKHQYNESEITERCWKGYTQKGMKTMFGKRYPNCVKIKK